MIDDAALKRLRNRIPHGGWHPSDAGEAADLHNLLESYEGLRAQIGSLTDIALRAKRAERNLACLRSENNVLRRLICEYLDATR